MAFADVLPERLRKRSARVDVNPGAVSDDDTPVDPDRAVALFPFARDTVFLVLDESGHWGPLWYSVQGEFGGLEYAHMMLRTELAARPATVRADILDMGIRDTPCDRWISVTGVLTPYSTLGVELTVRPVRKAELQAELANAAAVTHSDRARALYTALLDNWPQL